MKEAQIYLKQRKSTTITTTQTKEEEEEGTQKNSKKNKKEKKNHSNKSEQQPMEIDQTNHNNNHQSSSSSSSSMDEMFEKLTTSFPVNSIEFIPFHGKMISKKRTLLFQKFKNLTKGGVMISTDVAARGIDIPDVDWIIQLAAPKDPSFFVHRIGRTARAGKKGGAIIYLTKEEESYVELLRGRGVPLTSLTTTDSSSSSSSSLYHSHLCKIMPSYSSQDILELFKFISKNDRDALENGSTAFISFIRAYKENLCSYIFRLESLDIGGLARAYGLLRLPKIAETRGVKGKPIIFQTDPLDTSLIPYKNPEKEKARLRRIQQAKEAELQALEGNNNDDDDGDGSDIDSEDNQTKKSSFTTATGRMKKEWIPAEEFIRTEKKRERKKKQSFIAKMKDEWDELAAEEAMFKKLRKGKISQEMYEDGLFSEDIRKYQEDNENENQDDQDSEGDQDGPKRKKSRKEESSEEDDDGDDDSDEEDAPSRGSNKNKGKINNNHNNNNRPVGKKPFNQHHHQHHRGSRPGSSHKKNNNSRSFQRR
jgi:ATP-dependent RNA helicase DDX55/SPB4